MYSLTNFSGVVEIVWRGLVSGTRPTWYQVLVFIYKQ